MSALSGILQVMFMSVAKTGMKVEDWIRRQRLEPMVFGVEVPGLELSSEFIGECRQAYLNMTGRSQRFLHEAEQLQSIFDQRGIALTAARGAIFGRDLYGDPGLRYFTDLDLAVAPAHQWSALDVMLDAGYKLRSPWVPRWYLARHHLHWPLISADGRIPVDLHWATDHPYRVDELGTLDLTSLSPAIRQWITAIRHAEKESRLRFSVSRQDMEQRLLIDGPIIPWIDLALMSVSMTDEHRMEVVAKGIHQQTLVRHSCWVLSQYFGVAATTAWATEPTIANATGRRDQQKFKHSRLANRVGQWLGCRPETLYDAWAFLLSPPTSTPSASRGFQFLWRCAKVMRLIADSIVCGIWVMLRKWYPHRMGKPVAS